MRKNNERNIGIFSLLFRSSIKRLLWSFLVLFLLAVILAATFMPMANMPYFTLWMVEGRLAREGFDNIDNYGITDGKGYFEILDQELNVVFPEDSVESYTREDIDNVWGVDCLRARVQRNKYTSGGITYTQLICSGNENHNGWYLLVDNDYNYVESVNFPLIKDSYTESDLEYIQKELIYDVMTYKHEFITNKGDTFTMLIKYDEPAVILDENEIKIMIGVACGSAVLFLLFIFLSINSVSRKFRKPLKQLDAAMAGFAAGKYDGMFLDHKGVRELKTIMDTFNDMVSKLEESEAENKQLSQEKQRLIADISHDLKTPITIIQGYTDALSQGKISPEEQAGYLEKIHKKTTHLTKLINEFSYFSKIDYPAFKLELKQVDLCDLVRDYIAENYSYITDSGFDIEIDIPGDTYICSIDSTHFKRCILNILSNFIKYNPAGTIIHAAVYDDGEAYSVVLENNGLPIDSEIALRLFDPFVMGDKSRTSGKGSGLGLAVVKKIMELHGGSIHYLTKPDYINCFKMTLPKCEIIPPLISHS